MIKILYERLEESQQSYELQALWEVLNDVNTNLLASEFVWVKQHSCPHSLLMEGKLAFSESKSLCSCYHV